MKGVMPLFLFKGVKTHEKLKGAEHSVENEKELNTMWRGSIYHMRTQASDRTRILRRGWPMIPLS